MSPFDHASKLSTFEAYPFRVVNPQILSETPTTLEELFIAIRAGSRAHDPRHLSFKYIHCARRLYCPTADEIFFAGHGDG